MPVRARSRGPGRPPARRGRAHRSQERPADPPWPERHPVRDSSAAPCGRCRRPTDESGQDMAFSSTRGRCGRAAKAARSSTVSGTRRGPWRTPPSARTPTSHCATASVTRTSRPATVHLVQRTFFRSDSVAHESKAAWSELAKGLPARHSLSRRRTGRWGGRCGARPGHEEDARRERASSSPRATYSTRDATRLRSVFDPECVLPVSATASSGA